MRWAVSRAFFRSCKRLAGRLRCRQLSEENEAILETNYERKKAYRLPNGAWNYFRKHCPDTQAYHEDYLDSGDYDEFDAVLTRAEDIITRGEE
jgi:hypothetical protein